MSKTTLTFFQNLLCRVLKNGKIPNHIAFIMDGNRRYATGLGKNKLEGHRYGLQSLKKSLLICLNLGVKIATLFAFAIQNFNRQQKQVNTLMQLTKTNFKELASERGFFAEHQIQVKIVGNKQLIRQDVRQCLNQIEQSTKQFNKLKVYVCFAYNSTYEIEQSITKLGPNCTTHQIMQNLMIQECPEIIVRTSNQIRLSDFLTIQAMKSQVCFLKQTWPQMSIWSFLRIIIPYNLEYTTLKEQASTIDQKLNQQC